MGPKVAVKACVESFIALSSIFFLMSFFQGPVYSRDGSLSKPGPYSIVLPVSVLVSHSS
jgi:hypothetical protein